jgi:hypothetical protein
LIDLSYSYVLKREHQTRNPENHRRIGMGVIIGIAIAIAVGAVVIGLCASSGRAKLDHKIMRLREGEQK